MFGDSGARRLRGRRPRGRLGGEGLRHALDRCSSVRVKRAQFGVTFEIDEAFVKELAKTQPLRVVFRDAGFRDSAVKINIEQIFKLLSPGTEVKCI